MTSRRPPRDRRPPDAEARFAQELLDAEALGRFGHREHLHMAWSYIRRDGMPKATEQVIAFIKHVAGDAGAERYNETMTRFWVYVVALAMAKATDSDDFDRLLDDHPSLLDKRLPARHWTDELLASPAAKAAWVEPDLAPLPKIPGIAAAPT